MTLSHNHCASNVLFRWLESNADALDNGQYSSSDILSRLATEKLTYTGIPFHYSGFNTTTADAIIAISQVTYSSLTAGFVLWAHRAYMECLLQSPNAALRERQLPSLLNGTIAGATGLSNLMKHLAGLEKMDISVHREKCDDRLNGKMPWITNISEMGFFAACAAQMEDGRTIAISLEHADNGIEIEPLELVGLRASDTAAVSLSNVTLLRERILHDNIGLWLKSLRPAFIALQCGMSTGLAWRCLDEADKHSQCRGTILAQEIDTTRHRLSALQEVLIKGCISDDFVNHPDSIFKLRIALAECVETAIFLELKARGGKAYLEKKCEGFPRRLREASFVPIITPSVTQLQKAIAK